MTRMSRRHRKIHSEHCQALSDIADAISDLGLVIGSPLQFAAPPPNSVTIDAETARADAGWAQAAGQEEARKLAESRVEVIETHLRDATTAIAKMSEQEAELRRELEALKCANVEGARREARLSSAKSDAEQLAEKLEGNLDAALAEIENLKSSVQAAAAPVPAAPHAAKRKSSGIDLPEAAKFIATLDANGFSPEHIQSRFNANRDPSQRLNAAGLAIIRDLIEVIQCR